MLPDFLFAEAAVTKDGEGAAFKLNSSAGAVLQVTLGITEVVEQESLEVFLFGATGEEEWGAKPLTSFPQKFYKGASTILLDLSGRPEINQLRIKYKVNRWGQWTDGPMFKFYVFAEPLPVAQKSL